MAPSTPKPTNSLISKTERTKKENVRVENRDTNQKSQRWRILYVDERAKDATSGTNKHRNLVINKPFYIQSRLWMERVIQVQGGKNLVIATRKDNAKEQMWVFD